MKKIISILIVLFSLILSEVNAQNKGIEISNTNFLNQGDIDRAKYIFQNQILTTGKLFNSDISSFNLKIKYYWNDRWFVSLNQSNYGITSEGDETINSKINSAGIGIGYELRTGKVFNLWNALSLDFGIGAELRGNYNYDHEAVKIEIVGNIANQIKIKDEIEKFAPEFTLYLPKIIIGFIKADFLEIFIQPNYHIIYGEKLRNKFATTQQIKLLNINNTVELISLSYGLKFNF